MVLLVQVTLQQAAVLQALCMLNLEGLWQTAEAGSCSTRFKLLMPMAPERLSARGLTRRDNSGQAPSDSHALCFLHVGAKLQLATVNLFFHCQLLQNLIKMDFHVAMTAVSPSSSRPIKPKTFELG